MNININYEHAIQREARSAFVNVNVEIAKGASWRGQLDVEREHEQITMNNWTLTWNINHEH